MIKLLKIISIGSLAYFLLAKIANAPQIKEIMVKSIEELEKIPEEIIINKDISSLENLNEKYAELLRPAGRLKENYTEGECELAAKEFQKVYGGNLVFIAPYNADTTAWIICDYCSAWANKIYYKNKILWVDYPNKEIYSYKETLRQGITRLIEFKFPDTNVDSKIYVYGEDTMPYSIIWHY